MKKKKQQNNRPLVETIRKNQKKKCFVYIFLLSFS